MRHTDRETDRQTDRKRERDKTKDNRETRTKRQGIYILELENMRRNRSRSRGKVLTKEG